MQLFCSTAIAGFGMSSSQNARLWCPDGTMAYLPLPICIEFTFSSFFFFYFCVWTPSPSRERYLYCSFPIISLFCVVSFEEPVQHVYGSCQKKKKRSRGAFIGSIVGGAMPPCSDAACAVFFFPLQNGSTPFFSPFISFAFSFSRQAPFPN